MEQNAADSAKIREELEVIAPGVSYGWSLGLCRCVSHVCRRGAPVVIYIMVVLDTVEQDQCSYVAPGLVAAGINVLVLDFALAPTVSLDEILVRQSNRAAIAWAWHNARHLWLDRNQIHSIGHSSGGHLRHDAGHRLGGSYGLPADIIKSAVPCSGMYELEPVRFSHRCPIWISPGKAAARNGFDPHPVLRSALTMAWDWRAG